MYWYLLFWISVTMPEGSLYSELWSFSWSIFFSIRFQPQQGVNGITLDNYRLHLFFPHVFTVKQLQNAFLALTDAFFTPSTISLGFLRIDLLSFSFFWISYNFVTKWYGTLKVSPVALMVIFGLIALAVFSLGLGSLVNKFQIFFTSHFWCILLKLIFQEAFQF